MSTATRSLFKTRLQEKEFSRESFIGRLLDSIHVSLHIMPDVVNFDLTKRMF